MNDARLGAFAAPHFAGHQAHAACAAVARAAVKGQVDAVAQSSVQQQLAAACQKATAIDSNLVASCHCLIPEAFKILDLQLVRVTRRRGASWDPQQSDRSEPALSSLSNRNADSFYRSSLCYPLSREFDAEYGHDSRLSIQSLRDWCALIIGSGLSAHHGQTMAVEYLRAAGSGHFSWLPQKTIRKNTAKGLDRVSDRNRKSEIEQIASTRMGGTIFDSDN